MTTEEKLAAANALLVRVEQHPDVRGQLKDAIRAHLAGQEPAAGRGPVYGSSPVGGANLRPEYRQSCGEVLRRQSTRTEAEQRVLDACADCQLRYLKLHAENGMGSAWVAGIAEAELARRGLAP